MRPRRHRGRGLRITTDRPSEGGGGTGWSSAVVGGRFSQNRRMRLWVARYPAGSARRVSPRRPRHRGLRITIDRPASLDGGGGMGCSSAVVNGRFAQYRGRTGLWMAGYPAGSDRRMSPGRRRGHIREESANPAAAAPRRRHLRITIERPLRRRAAARRVVLRGPSNRFSQYRGRTGLWSVVELPPPPQRGGLSHRITAQAFTCRLMSSGFSRAELPSSTGYVRGCACAMPGRIGQANETTSPSPIREESANPAAAALAPRHRRLRITIADPLSRRAAAGRFVFAVARRSTADVGGCACDGRGCGLAGELPYPPQRRGSVIPSVHKHSRACLCRQDSAEQSFPAVPGTYAVLRGVGDFLPRGHPPPARRNANEMVAMVRNDR